MPRIVREATSSWEGDLARGSGRITATTSGAFADLAFSFPTRIGTSDGRTSPEELLAAAHAGCFAMSLGNELSQAGATPTRLAVRCAITLDEVPGEGHRIVDSQLEVRADAPAADDAALSAAVVAADEGCPFSALLRAAGADVTVTAERA